MERLLITICGRAGSKGFKNKNLKTFCERPLVYYSLSAAELFSRARGDVRVDVCLNTDSEPLAALVAQKYPEVTYLPRQAELGGDRVAKMAVIQDSLARMEEKNACRYDYVMDLDITSPLRTAQDIRNAYELMEAGRTWTWCSAPLKPAATLISTWCATRATILKRGSRMCRARLLSPRARWRPRSMT